MLPILTNLYPCTYAKSSGLSFLFNADVMISALFGTSENRNCLFLVPKSIFAKYFYLRIHFHGFQPVSKDCSHVTMCTNPMSSYYALMFRCLNFNTVHKREI